MARVKDDTKIKAIQEAAMSLVIKTGFVGLKMADVASTAGLATGTVYIYYQSKEELINEVYRATKEEIASVFNNEKYQADTFYETVQNLWMGYFTFCFNYPQKMLFVEQFLYSGYIAEEMIRKTELFLEPLNHFIRDGQKKGLIRDIDIEIIKAQVQGPVHEIVKMEMQKRVSLTKELISQCFDMAWNSIRR